MCEHQPHPGILGSRRNTTKKIRCPSCKSAAINLTQFHPGQVERFAQNDDYTIQSLGSGQDTTGESYVMAHCQICSNEWRVRGLSHVRDLRYTQIIEAPVPQDGHETHARTTIGRPADGL